MNQPPGIRHEGNLLKLYSLFLLMATVTILSPGPGVVMTLTNAMRYGMRGTLGGILGLALGILVVATISATGLGVLLATSAMAFTVIKFVGAAYLIYLGIRLWLAPVRRLSEHVVHDARFGKRFLEGMSIQLTNPKTIFFFLSIFPQFIDPNQSYPLQFAGLAVSFSVLLIIIHILYALSARRARTWLGSERGGRTLNRVGGSLFIVLGTALATAKR